VWVSTYACDPTKGWVLSGVSLMLKLRGSDFRLLVRGGGGGGGAEEPLLVALRLPGGVKGVNGPWELDARRCSAELDVTGDWNGVWGGTRLGSFAFLLEVRLEEVEALAEELCVPGAVKGDGSKGRDDDDDDDDDDWLLPRAEEEAAWGGPSSLEMNSTLGPLLSHDVAYPRSLLLA